jgi:hypothetical protein
MEYIFLRLLYLVWSFRGHLDGNKNLVVEITKMVKQVKHGRPLLEHSQDHKHVSQVNTWHISLLS